MDLLLILLPFIIAGIICYFQEDSKAYGKRFGILFAIGLLCSTIPWLHFGAMFGYYAYTLNAAVVAALMEFKK